MTRLAELRALLAKATNGGNWSVDDLDNDHLITAGKDDDGAFVYVCDAGWGTEDDRRLILWGLHALPALLDVAEAAQRVCDDAHPANEAKTLDDIDSGLIRVLRTKLARLTGTNVIGDEK